MSVFSRGGREAVPGMSSLTAASPEPQVEAAAASAARRRRQLAVIISMMEPQEAML